jgi:hypothetical protein
MPNAGELHALDRHAHRADARVRLPGLAYLELAGEAAREVRRAGQPDGEVAPVVARRERGVGDRLLKERRIEGGRRGTHFQVRFAERQMRHSTATLP